jgi:hypothetical protein
MYPDANFTMRLTYGEVKDYIPMDAVHYDYLTTIEGVMEKEDPDNWEFVVPQRLKTYTKQKTMVAMPKTGKLPVAFIYTQRHYRRKLGSPVMNGNGANS